VLRVVAAVPNHAPRVGFNPESFVQQNEVLVFAAVLSNIFENVLLDLGAVIIPPDWANDFDCVGLAVF